MNGEQQGQTDEDAGTIDSIALEAIASKSISGNQPCANSDYGATVPSARQAQNIDLNLEYVDGERIDEYCDSRHLDVPARLRLFKQVCDAVHFAHQRGIIHCDLRPNNILVTSASVPKLVNFGNAKSVHRGFEDDPDAAGLALNLIRTGEPALTPEYASPEQVKGETTTTASDIYSLGVILYVLLTGRGPYYLKTGDISEVLQAICEQVPEKPSQITAAQGSSAERLKRTISRDLDSIILMAMRKEPERRYRSADHFANDLDRYLLGLPVCAHHGSTVYRVNKFMRRHAVAVLITGALLSALIAGVAVSATALIMTRRARDRAEESSRLGYQAVNHFFTRVSQERLLDQPGLHQLRNKLLEDTQRFYEAFLSRRSGDRALRAELALARTQLAQISSATGSTTEAVGQFQQAVALWEDLVSTQPANPAYREELAHALNKQGLVVMRLKGRSALALHIFHRARELIEPQVTNAHSPAASHELSLILLNIGEVQKERDQSDEAIKSIQRSLLIEPEGTMENSGSLDSSIAMAKGHALLGQLFLRDSTGVDRALAEYQQAIRLLEKVTRLHPELPDQALELALLQADLNRIQQMAGKLDSALGSAGKAVEILERIDRQYPGVPDYEEALAGTYRVMSDLYRQRREPSQALAFAQKAQILLSRLIEVHPENVNFRLELAKSQNILGRMLQQTGEPVEALRSFQRAIDIYESMPELNPYDSYLLACNIALSVRLVGVRTGSADTIELSKLSKADLLRRERYGNRAVELLHRAVAEGTLNVDILRSDTDLDPLRDRPDFQSLLTEAAEKTTNAKQ